jgi:hypothetical protein
MWVVAVNPIANGPKIAVAARLAIYSYSQNSCNVWHDGAETRKGKGLLPCPLVDLTSRFSPALERLNVGGLPALRSLHNIELHGLAFLQTLKSV